MSKKQMSTSFQFFLDGAPNLWNVTGQSSYPSTMDTLSPFEQLEKYPCDLGKIQVGRAVAISDDEYVLFPIRPKDMICKYSITTNTWTKLMKLTKLMKPSDTSGRA